MRHNHDVDAHGTKVGSESVTGESGLLGRAALDLVGLEESTKIGEHRLFEAVPEGQDRRFYPSREALCMNGPSFAFECFPKQSGG